MVKVKTVFYCTQGHDPLAVVASGPVVCEKCKGDMREIGWFEENINEVSEEEE